MRRGVRNWVWVGIFVWAILLMVVKANAEDVKPEVVATVSEKAEILAGFDAYKIGLKKYLDAMEKANKAHKLPENTEWVVNLDKCDPQANGKVVCERSVAPRKAEVKSNVPAPAPVHPTAEEPKK